jgi:hypothetical protein
MQDIDDCGALLLTLNKQPELPDNQPSAFSLKT